MIENLHGWLKYKWLKAFGSDEMKQKIKRLEEKYDSK